MDERLECLLETLHLVNVSVVDPEPDLDLDFTLDSPETTTPSLEEEQPLVNTLEDEQPLVNTLEEEQPLVNNIEEAQPEPSVEEDSDFVPEGMTFDMDISDMTDSIDIPSEPVEPTDTTPDYTEPEPSDENLDEFLVNTVRNLVSEEPETVESISEPETVESTPDLKELAEKTISDVISDLASFVEEDTEDALEDEPDYDNHYNFLISEIIKEEINIGSLKAKKKTPFDFNYTNTDSINLTIEDDWFEFDQEEENNTKSKKSIFKRGKKK